ncbi:MAG TPA: PTS sugar transporter subunit IIC [Gemmatimonadaceae bacterium]|nr:PTS sugar transporter subunit IIC [Gemmatimonadaceae bacterium]
MLLDLLPIALLGAVLGMDVVTFPQAMISRPIVAATLAGAFIGNAPAGLVMGAVLELLALEMLPFGASRYPDWGSASVVGGALYAGQAGDPAGALAATLLGALATAMLSGRSMVWLRRLNASIATRERDKLDKGSIAAVTGLQLIGLTADMARGFFVTLVAMAAFTPLVRAIVVSWGTGARSSRGVVVAIVAAVSAGAVWKIFHVVGRARILFVVGLSIGAAALLTR